MDNFLDVMSPAEMQEMTTAFSAAISDYADSADEMLTGYLKMAALNGH